MKILLVNKFLFSKGGDAICTLSTGKLLLKKGHEVSYWGMDHPENPDYPHSELFVEYIDLVDGGGPLRRMKTALNVLYSYQARRKIRKMLENERPDVVHLNNFAHQISPSILDVLDECKIPTVMTMHDYKLVCPAYTMLRNGKVCEECKGGRYYRCFVNRCTHNSRCKSLLNVMEMYLHHRILHIYDKIDVFISPSLFLKDKLREMGFVKEIVHLPNFVNLGDYSPRYNSQQRSIVYFGRLSQEKGLFTLLDAVKGLDLQLRIIGEGPVRENLGKKTAIERIDNVTFMGYKWGKKLKKEIQDAMATVTPSQWYENNPRSIIESFALGRPVIGARIGGIPELVKDNETGYAFESGNVDDLRLKINLLIENPEKAIQMGKSARNFVEQNNNPEKYYRRLIGLYKMARKINN